MYFEYVKESYLKINNITDYEQQADIVKMILCQNYGIMGETFKEDIVAQVKQERRDATVEQIGGINDFEIEPCEVPKAGTGGLIVSSLLCGKGHFNEEDLLFLNRVAFYILCKNGGGVTF